MIRSKAAAFVILFAAACARAPAPALPAPEDPPGQSAAAILNECRATEADRQLACHEAAVLAVLDSGGVAAAMSVAERMGDLDPEVRRHGHVYAHAVGLAAYTTPEEVGEIFASCTAAYQSGCYHGVIQSYFVDLAGGDAQGVDEEAVNELCAGQRGEAGDRWLLFQCAHGIGHGVTMLNDHHLPSSLQACDLVRDDWEREACYGGAFMESLVQAIMPHHTVGRPAHEAEDAHAHHGAPAAAKPSPHGDHHPDAHAGHSVTAASEEFPPLRPEDPLYPCSALEDRYLASCYQMQTSAILFFNGRDFTAAAEVCETAPAAYRASCFQSLGRDVSAETVQDHERAVELCAPMGSWRFDCHRGYVKNVVDVTADARDGFRFCSIVEDHEGRRRCYEAVGEQVWILAMETPGREGMCAGAEPEYREACRRGAGLPVRGAPEDEPGAGHRP